ncbi:MAG: acylphosphatase [Chlamydiales bacterium]|nr:acylphosphatase [Chlamydiia bacterium]MCP5507470.1 acylphosphatase [Chlamydiales bacterium]
MNDSATKTIHVIFHGRVQGVFFRATTEKHANKLGIVGTVRNLPEGTVELYAQGTEEQLDQLLKRIQEADGNAKVERVEIKTLPSADPFQEFSIL